MRGQVREIAANSVTLEDFRLHQDTVTSTLDSIFAALGDVMEKEVGPLRGRMATLETSFAEYCEVWVLAVEGTTDEVNGLANAVDPNGQRGVIVKFEAAPVRLGVRVGSCTRPQSLRSNIASRRSARWPRPARWPRQRCKTLGRARTSDECDAGCLSALAASALPHRVENIYIYMYVYAHTYIHVYI